MKTYKNISTQGAKRPADRSKNTSTQGSRRPVSKSRNTGTQSNRRPVNRSRNNTNRSGGNRRPIPQQTLKVCTLSGTSGIGRNANFLEYGNDIIIVDMGSSFPDAEMHGIDSLIPNISYLKKNKHRIKGIFLTHGHLDHMGALPYVLKDLDFPPIYAGAFAVALIEEKLKDHNLGNRVKFHKVKRSQEIKAGAFSIKFIGVNHSIPDAFALFIQSPKGNVFVSGDYKIDRDPANEPETDYEELKKLRGRVDLALMESTNPYNEGKAQSETEIEENLERIIRKHDDRVMVAAFGSLVTRLYSVMQIAQRTNKKVVLAGRSILTSVDIARKQRYIDIPDNLLVSEREIHKHDSKNLIVLMTGSQAERYAALNRMSLREHKWIKAKSTDLLIMSASEIPDNVYKIEKMTDRLVRLGIKMINNKEADVHSTGHGYQEDMKIMYELVQPKHIMPVHGSMTFRYKNKKNYVIWGHDMNKVHLTDNGQVWSFVNNGWKKTTSVESKPILIDGLGVGEIGDIVLKDRTQLAEYGLFAVVMNLSQKNNMMIGRPRFISRGFIYMKSSMELLKELENIVMDTHRQWQKKSQKANRFEKKDLIHNVERNLSKVIYKKTEREPIIIPVTI